MRSSENILNLAKIMPDYMGFIFGEHSKCFVSNPTPELGKEIKKVGVFVNASLNYIKECVEVHKLKAIQLHGDESPEECSKLKKLKLRLSNLLLC